MANPEHIEILEQGVNFWNKWREENKQIIPDLSNLDLKKTEINIESLENAKLNGTIFIGSKLLKTNLSAADLTEANLWWADLSEAKLRGADLTDANFRASKLKSVDLGDAILVGADLSGTDLRGANLQWANLTEAIIRFAELEGANFKKATMGNSALCGLNLSRTKGLETVKHIGASFIDVSTFYLSNCKIPRIFLQGAGIPDEFIENISSFSEKAVEFYSCFISYSSKDQKFAERLHADFQNHGVRCWFAPEDLKVGDKIRQRIDESIRLRDKLLLILSEDSINSEWVEDEVETAYEEEKKRKMTVLFPVRIDNSVMQTDQAWASKLRRSRHIGDFTQWKDQNTYQKTFERLLRDLKAER